MVGNPQSKVRATPLVRTSLFRSVTPISKAPLFRSKGHSKPKPKEKLFHPQSRKAAQLERAHLRQHKLTSAKSKRGKVQNERSWSFRFPFSGDHHANDMSVDDRFVFFHHALTSDVPSLTLPEIHDIIKDVWLHRHDVAIAEEAATRRKGEPRSSKEDKLLAAKEADKEEYRTGLGKARSPYSFLLPPLTPVFFRDSRPHRSNDG